MFVVGSEHELALYDTRNRSWKVLVSGIDAGVSGTIINDGTCYGSNLVFGSKDLEFKTAKAGLYLYRGADKRLIQLRNDQVCSNGKDVVSSGSGLHLLDIDSPTRKVVRYRLDINDGTVSDCETVIDVGNLASVPDGMVLTPGRTERDHQLLQSQSGRIRRNASIQLAGWPAGSDLANAQQSTGHLSAVELNIQHGNVKLVITTAVEHMPVERQGDSPWAGGLFVADTPFHHAPALSNFKLN